MTDQAPAPRATEPPDPARDPLAAREAEIVAEYWQDAGQTNEDAALRRLAHAFALSETVTGQPAEDSQPVPDGEYVCVSGSVPCLKRHTHQPVFRAIDAHARSQP